MSLRERVEEKPTPARYGGLDCSIGRALAQLTDDDREWFEEWCASDPRAKGRRSDPDVAADLSAELGSYVSVQMVGHHRRRRCSCYTGEHA